MLVLGLWMYGTLVVFDNTTCIASIKTVFRIVTFWYRSGSADLYLWLTDPAPDPAIFVSDLQDKKSYRSHKTVGIKVFLTNFAWWYARRIQSRICTSYGTNGYGSERTKNIWIRIRNTASKSTLSLHYFSDSWIFSFRAHLFPSNPEDVIQYNLNRCIRLATYLHK